MASVLEAQKKLPKDEDASLASGDVFRVVMATEMLQICCYKLVVMFY